MNQKIWVFLTLIFFKPLFAETMNLTTDWEYAPLPFLEKSNLNNLNWTKTNLPVRFSSMAEYQNYQGYIVLRREVPETIITWLREGKSLSLKTAKMGDVVELYFNNEKLASFGQKDPYVPGLYRYFLIDIPKNALEKNKKNYFYIYLYSNGIYPMHVERDLFLVGFSEEIYKKHFYEEILQFSLLSIYLVVGLYHLLLAIRRRKDIYNLFFGLFSILVSFYWFLFTGSRDLLFGDHQILRTKVEYVVVFHLPVTLFLFFATLFRRPKSYLHKFFWWYLYLYIALVILLSLFVIFGDYPIMQRSLKIWQMSLFVDLVIGLTFIAYESFKKNIDAIYLAGGIVILFSGALVDLLIALEILNIPRISQYTFLAFILGLAGVLANRFVRVHNEVEELNISLEKKVQERTYDLEMTLREVKALKEQQDGDYFLMSLLINPLLAKQEKTEHGLVQIKTFARQKKQFSFRKWQREIGGDLNMVHKINLRGKDYLVILNADAMGKSLQGASGSLVLGAVFLSIIERAHLNKNEQQKFPERWMKDAFIEMQKVFESFDGSMLVSLVFALLDIQRGLLYYLNAEHPFPVLYRDGKASFLPHSVIFRKLGSQVIHGQMQIDTFLMQSGDTVVLGSDGRDDLIIGQNENGEVIINEDETLFLKRVEEGKGDPQLIFEALTKQGQIYDDLSLLSISFDLEHKMLQENKELSDEEKTILYKNAKIRKEILEKLNFIEEKLKQEKPSPLYYKEAMKLYARLGNLEATEKMMALYENHCPEDEEFLYLASYLLHRLGKISLAIDYGERLRLRNPYYEKNILNLAEMYRKTKNLSRSFNLLQDFLKYQPENLVVREALERIKQKIEAFG